MREMREIPGPCCPLYVDVTTPPSRSISCSSLTEKQKMRFALLAALVAAVVCCTLVCCTLICCMLVCCTLVCCTLAARSFAARSFAARSFDARLFDARSFAARSFDARSFDARWFEPVECTRLTSRSLRLDPLDKLPDSRPGCSCAPSWRVLTSEILVEHVVAERHRRRDVLHLLVLALRLVLVLPVHLIRLRSAARTRAQAWRCTVAYRQATVRAAPRI